MIESRYPALRGLVVSRLSDDLSRPFQSASCAGLSSESASSSREDEAWPVGLVPAMTANGGKRIHPLTGSKSVRAFAPAKLNLALCVTGRRGDGYHVIDTFALFADVGDELTAGPAAALSLDIEGPFAKALSVGTDNLVLKAAQRLRDHAQASGKTVPGAHLVLTKSVPVAAGMGGGSADAAAVLRALNALWGLGLGPAGLQEIGATIGADVPMCIHSRALRARGIGEIIEPLEGFPELAVLLVNPLRPVPTAEVFLRLARREAPPFDPPPLPGSVDRVLAWLAGLGNDLETPAREIEPEIGDVLAALRDLEGVRLARMSGSGATCFAIFPDMPAARTAAARLLVARPRWWIAAARAR